MKTKWYTNFSEWPGPEVLLTFGLSRIDESPTLTGWIQCPEAPAPADWLDLRRRELRAFLYVWNELELLARFISPLLSAVNFWGPGYSLFHGRTLRLDWQGQQTAGAVDGLVAAGVSGPEAPYFFLQEYKKSSGYEADPEGQLLIAMVAAQHQQTDGSPLYGCYIVGNLWRFVVLENQSVSESQAYDATDAGELRIIWNILHETKRRIEARVALHQQYLP